MTQTPAFYFDIMEILSRGRCPGCELTRSKALHYIDHALYGLVTDPYAQNLSNLPAEYPAACCGDERGLFPLPWEGKLKMGWGQETGKTIKIGE